MQVESEKKFFRGQEVSGKTLGVVGLGNIGAAVAENALALGALPAAWVLQHR